MKIVLRLLNVRATEEQLGWHADGHDARPSRQHAIRGQLAFQSVRLKGEQLAEGVDERVALGLYRGDCGFNGRNLRLRVGDIEAGRHAIVEAGTG